MTVKRYILSMIDLSGCDKKNSPLGELVVATTPPLRDDNADIQEERLCDENFGVVINRGSSTNVLTTVIRSLPSTNTRTRRKLLVNVRLAHKNFPNSVISGKG
mmetsp:Transcript_6791/g.9791  ORF Transcript_6791/g.9791 Transcript_6791/m.9791 type:complete len:103 (-) Transcript_6791:368-676(-)